jgi:OOP family OmpA-OmpF porin
VSKPGYVYKSLSFNYSVVEDFEPIVVNIELEKIRKGSIVVLNNIFFDLDKYELKEKSRAELAKIVRFMNSNPAVRIEVSGHTDNLGTSDYNLVLSQKRAQAVTTYLIDSGINRSRIIPKGYGASMPVGDNTTEDGRQLNRRIEFRIIGNN